MILDASAVIVILRDEPEAARFAQAIQDAGHRRISAVNYVEAAAVIDGSSGHRWQPRSGGQPPVR